jgi:hypothetical protein
MAAQAAGQSEPVRGDSSIGRDGAGERKEGQGPLMTPNIISGVYVIFNLVTGKGYVGQSKQLS